MIFKRKNRDGGGTSSKQSSFVRISSPQNAGDAQVGSLDMSSICTHNAPSDENEDLFDGSVINSLDFKCNSSISSADKGNVSLSNEIWSTSDVDDMFSKESESDIFNPFHDPGENKTSFFPNKNVEYDLRKISPSYISDDDTGRDSMDSASPSSMFDNFFEPEAEERSRISDKDLSRAFGFDFPTVENTKNIKNDNGSESFPYFQPDGLERKPAVAVVSPIRNIKIKRLTIDEDPTMSEAPPNHEEALIDEHKEKGDINGHESKVSDFLTTYFDKDTVHSAVNNAVVKQYRKGTSVKSNEKVDFPCDENEFTFVRETSIITNGSGVKSFDESTCSEETQVTSNTDKRSGSVDEFSQQNLNNPYGLRNINSKSSVRETTSDVSLAYSSSVAEKDNSLVYSMNSTTSNDDSSVFSGLISSESFRQKLMFLSHEEIDSNPSAVDNKRAKYIISVVNNNDVHSVQDSYTNTSILEKGSCKSKNHPRQITPIKEKASSICPVDSIQTNFEAFTDMLLDKFQLSVI